MFISITKYLKIKLGIIKGEKMEVPEYEKKMEVPEYMRKLKIGKRYLIGIGAREYYFELIPDQYTGIFKGVEENNLIFTDIMIHHAPYCSEGNPLRRESIAKIPLNIGKSEYRVYTYPESGEPIEINSPKDLENPYILEISRRKVKNLERYLKERKS